VNASDKFERLLPQALRAIEAGFKIYYDPSLVVFHPRPLKDGYQSAVGRAYMLRGGYRTGLEETRLPTLARRVLSPAPRRRSIVEPALGPPGQSSLSLERLRGTTAGMAFQDRQQKLMAPYG
jgi:hypothetical protein